jgi:hypothetical protein
LSTAPAVAVTAAAPAECGDVLHRMMAADKLCRIMDHLRLTASMLNELWEPCAQMSTSYKLSKAGRKEERPAGRPASRAKRRVPS